jgi:hypothetical protein
MASRFPPAAQAAALAPAGLGLWLLIVVVQLRMDEPWANGVLFVVAVVPAAVLLALAFAAAGGDNAPRPEATILAVAGLSLAAVSLPRLGTILAGDDFADTGGTFTLLLALFTALAVYCERRTRLSVCVLIAAVAGVGLFLEFVHWVFGADDIDTYRVLLAIVFAVLFGAGVVLAGRTGTMLVVAAGLTVIASYYTTVFAVLFGDTSGLGWGWELITLLEGLALAAYAAVRLERGPGYLAFFVLLLFAVSAALVGDAVSVEINGEQFADEGSSASLVGWPLVLLIGTIAAAGAGVRGQVAAKS